jgi:Zn ribbon nucleic-acid-binding protein
MYIVIDYRIDAPYRHGTATMLRAFVERSGVTAYVRIVRDGVRLYVLRDDPDKEKLFKHIDTHLPASLFIRGIEASTAETIDEEQYDAPATPLSVAVCPTCQKEMFDVASRRYYYPFTSCNACGRQHAFVERYPYERKHTLMRFFVPCEACEEELKSNPLRKDYPLISCVDCGIAMRMTDKRSERFANGKGEYRQLFEVSARALSKGKSVLVKTLSGYRLFYRVDEKSYTPDTRLMVTDAHALNELFVLIPEEFNALLSIERPILRVSLKDERLKSVTRAVSVRCKFADDGVSMLLGRELLNTGFSYIGYEPADEDTQADYRVDFDVPVRFSHDCELFVVQDHRAFIGGERLFLGRYIPDVPPRLCVQGEHIVAPFEKGGLTEFADRFDAVDAEAVYIAEGDAFESGHSREVRFVPEHTAMLSVLAEHDKLAQPAIGVHFDERLRFMYYDGTRIRDVMVSEPLRYEGLTERIASLREGSDRLMRNFAATYPQRYEALLSRSGNGDIFEAAAVILGLEHPGYETLLDCALGFLSKGGVQVDARNGESGFDEAAFLASVTSYVLAGTDSAMLAYSMFESLGDYFGDTLNHIIKETKITRIVLTGRFFANAPLHGRIMRNLGHYAPLFNKTLPMSGLNALVGALYMQEGE